MIRIGVTVAAGDTGHSEYGRALESAGAVPVQLEVGAYDPADALEGLAGLLLTGGPDIDPALYEQRRSDRTQGVDGERDRFEIELAIVAREREIPTLAICRGIQIANVAFGGALIQDIPERAFAAAVPHRVVDSAGNVVRGVLPRHVVRIVRGSLLEKIVQTTDLATNSRHHQSLEMIAPALRVVGHTDDGVVEAAEAMFPSPFWLGVQWHPESTLDDGGASIAIFTAFVAACERQPVAGLLGSGS